MVNPARALLSWLVEIDETQISYRTKKNPVAGGGGRSPDGKMQVVAAVEIIDKTVRDAVLADPAPFRCLAAGLAVKEVHLGARHYVVCRNPIEAERDARMREGIIDRRRTKLRQGPKAVVGNCGFARFLTLDKGAVTIDTAVIEADARFDGVFVLRTNSEQPADEVAQLYKGLWRVERAFREVKSTLKIRPIYPHNDDACVGHLVAGFLALRLEVDLQRRLDAAGDVTPWPDLMRDLAQAHAVVVDLDGQRYRLRTDLTGSAHAAFAAAGVRPPASRTSRRFRAAPWMIRP